MFCCLIHDVVFEMCRLSLGTRATEGLTLYVPTTQSQDKKKGSVSEKKSGKEASNASIEDSSLLLMPLQRDAILGLPLFSNHETLVYSSVLMMIVMLAYTILGYCMGVVPFSSPALLLSCAVVFTTLGSLTGVSILSNMTSSDDKIYSYFFSSVGFIACVACFAMEPSNVFSWSPNAAAEAAASLLRHFVETAFRRSSIEVSSSKLDMIQSPSSAVGILFALLGAWVTAVFYLPAVRFVRAFHLQLSPPGYAQKQLKPFRLGSTRLRLEMILPMALPLLYVIPFVRDLAGLSGNVLILTRAVSLLGCGLLFIFNTRLLVCRYLETVLISWYTMKHGYYKTKLEKIAAYSIVKANADVVQVTVMKATIQAFAPGILYLACGLSILGSYFFNALYNDPGSGYVSEFVDHSVGFLVSSIGITWFIICGFCLWLFRTGTLVH